MQYQAEARVALEELPEAPVVVVLEAAASGRGESGAVVVVATVSAELALAE
jgi:succinyl-CoA synthetase beta subunit